MRTRHDRGEILDAAIEVAHAGGLHQLTFGRVAKRLGIADRTVVYYFPNKHELAAAVITETGRRLRTILETSLTTRAADHRELVTHLWPMLGLDDNDGTMRTYVEAIGLAAAGTDPYHSLVPQLIDQWAAWAATHIDHPQADEEAATALAIIDGLLVLRHVANPRLASTAADRLALTDDTQS